MYMRVALGNQGFAILVSLGTTDLIDTAAYSILHMCMCACFITLVTRDTMREGCRGERGGTPGGLKVMSHRRGSI